MKLSRFPSNRPNYGQWVPWGLYDHRTVSHLSGDQLQMALGALKVRGNKKTAIVRDRLRKIALTYWALKRDFDRPNQKWYRDQIKSIRRATDTLSGLLHELSPTTALSFLSVRMKMRTEHPLFSAQVGQSNMSLAQLLQGLGNACDDCLRVKGTAGAKKRSHTERATRDLVELWRDFVGSEMGLSLGTAPGQSEKEFIYRGPQFVYTTLKAIDSEISLTEVSTALRRVLGKRNVVKSTTP
ncbi:MAG: hypothetical protein JO220_16085 [Hyphomicrobiales bacterium]|nr:hypothetical protein [Hyphomicrobiales bacterium]